MSGTSLFRSAFVATIGLAALATASCRSTSGTSTLRDDSSTPPVVDPSAAIAVAAKAALDKNCASCHSATNAQGTIGYITDLQKLVDKKKVKRGTADDQKKSRVLVRLKDTESPMPPLTDDNNNPIPRVSDDDQKAIETWILADSPVPAATPAVPVVPAPPAMQNGDVGEMDAGPAALATSAKAALDKYCASCHNATNAQGTIGYITDLQKLIDKKKVKRGTADDHAKSRILVRILDVESPMPPLTDDNNNPIPRPNTDEIKAVQAWIDADSPVPAVPAMGG